jgi:hypothetical protein
MMRRADQVEDENKIGRLWEGGQLGQNKKPRARSGPERPNMELRKE